MREESVNGTSSYKNLPLTDITSQCIHNHIYGGNESMKVKIKVSKRMHQSAATCRRT